MGIKGTFSGCLVALGFGGIELVSNNRPSPCSKMMSETHAETARLRDVSLGQEIVGRIGTLAVISGTSETLARIFLTREHRAAAELILGWMREAGLGAHLDAIGNVCGRSRPPRTSSFTSARLSGVKLGDLPIKRASKCALVINQKTTKALGITLPRPRWPSLTR